jgi:hypothetical protein
VRFDVIEILFKETLPCRGYSTSILDPWHVRYLISPSRILMHGLLSIFADGVTAHATICRRLGIRSFLIKRWSVDNGMPYYVACLQ